MAASKYLIAKQQSVKKGKLIKYKKLQMGDYFLAKSKTTLEDIFSIFALRTKINDLQHNVQPHVDMVTKRKCPTFTFYLARSSRRTFEMLWNGNVQENNKAKNLFKTKIRYPNKTFRDSVKGNSLLL